MAESYYYRTTQTEEATTTNFAQQTVSHNFRLPAVFSLCDNGTVFYIRQQASYVELLNDLDQLKLLGKDIQMNENEVRERLGHYVKSVRSARWPKADNTVCLS